MFINYFEPYFQGLLIWQRMFEVGSRIRNQTFFRSFFRYAGGNFSKFLGSKFIVLLGLSICIVISKSFSNAFFRDSRILNLKILGFQNFCLPLIYLDIEFHQNRLNPYGSQFFQVHKFPVLFENSENAY